MIYLMFFFGSFVGVLGNAFMKFFGRTVPDSGVGDGVYYAVNVPVALLYFGLMCGFDLRVNSVTLMFAAAFSVVCYLAVFFQLRAFRYASLVNVSIFSSAGTLVVTSLAGVILFDEKISPKEMAGFLFTLISVAVPYIVSKKDRPGMKGLLYCILFALNGVLVRVIMKLYYTVPEPMNENVFCFYTNVFLFPFVLMMKRKTFFEQGFFRETITKYKKAVIIAAAVVVCSNISTLISMVFLGKVDLFVSAVLAPPITICFNFLFDIILFKEKIKVSNVLSTLCAVAAMLFMI